MSLQQRSSAVWLALLIAATLLLSYAYFPDFQGGWNQNSRFDTVRAITERHRLYIDGYDANTGDKATSRGHIYSDKAPGLALTGAPVSETVRKILRAAHHDPAGPRAIVAESYIVTVVCVSLPSALAAACLFLIALELGASLGGAAFAAITWGLATPLWAYATLFWGHAPTAAWLVFTLGAVLLLQEFKSPGRDLLLAICIGLACGWATVTEFPSAVPAAILVSLALAYAWSGAGGSQRLFRVAAGVAIGAIPCALILMLYNDLAFGSPFKLGYALSAQQGWPLMRQGLMGITYPKMHVLREVLIGSFRGILPLTPVLAAAPFGLSLLWKRARTRAIAIALTAIALFYILLNASYADWNGGSTYGPRFLSPGLPFLCLPLALLWKRRSLPSRSLLSLLALYGFFLSLMAVSINILPPDDVQYPVQQFLWPTFAAGQLSWNLGTSIGLHGLASLIPLFLLWDAALVTSLWLQSEPTATPAKALEASSPPMEVELHT